MKYGAFRAAVCILAPALLLTGCGGAENGEAPRLTPVSGTVTLDGKPVEGLTVWFVPQTGTPGNGASGKTADDGTYSLVQVGGESGVQPGEYEIMFLKYQMPDGSPVPPDVDPNSVGAVQAIPQRYTQSGTSGMTATVTNSAGTFDFELKSR